jgi:hypothetical protein
VHKKANFKNVEVAFIEGRVRFTLKMNGLPGPGTTAAEFFTGCEFHYHPMVVITEEIEPELAVVGAYTDDTYIGVQLKMKVLEGKKNKDGFTYLGSC